MWYDDDRITDLISCQRAIKEHLLLPSGKLRSVHAPADSKFMSLVMNLTSELKTPTVAGRLWSILSGVPTCPICEKRPRAYFNGLLKTCGDPSCVSTCKGNSVSKTKRAHGPYPRQVEAARAGAAELQKKGRATLLKKHGVTNAYQLPGIPEKAQENRKALSLDRTIKRHRQLEQRFQILIDSIENRSSNPMIQFRCAHCLQPDTKSYYTLAHRLKLAGTVCATCGNFQAGSLEQVQLFNFVRTLAPDAELNNRQVISPLELDIWVPSRRLGIEYHGFFWHSSPQIDESRKLDHQIKFLAAHERGIKLLQIWSHHDPNENLALVRTAIEKGLAHAQTSSVEMGWWLGENVKFDLTEPRLHCVQSRYFWDSGQFATK